MTNRRRRSVLIISQVFPPDPASVGQHLADLGSELVTRGVDTTVLTARRGYDDPTVEYERTSMTRGVRVTRLRMASFGKNSIAMRAVGGMLFTIATLVRGVFSRRVDAVIVSTVPPTGPLAAVAIAAVRRAKLIYWVMDLNPDQAIEMGLTARTSIVARSLAALNRSAFRRADLIVVLDAFMERRLRAEYGVTHDIVVSAPWSHDEHLGGAARNRNPFRTSLGVRDDQVVFMYAGNHGDSLPLDTFLAAAAALRDDDRVIFVFAGGGSGKPAVERYVVEHGLSRVHCLPYQAMECLADLLSAADVHLVTMGPRLVGVNHPCKIYGAMAAHRAILYVGPAPSHMSEIIDGHDVGWRVAHGDVDGVVAVILNAVDMTPEELERLGANAEAAIRSDFAPERLLGAVVDPIMELL